jgi:cation transport regulator ChaC
MAVPIAVREDFDGPALRMLAKVTKYAAACGHAGSCAEYLYQTVKKLEEHGFRDRNLWRLQELVAAEIQSWRRDVVQGSNG